MNELIIFKTSGWVVSHRSDSRYPGYLMVSSVEKKDELHQLTTQTINELGNVLSQSEKLLISVYSPHKVILAKLGFSLGFSCHFHVLPISYDLLNQITAHPNYTNETPDGKDAMLFVSREYCEKSLNAAQKQIILQEVIKLKEQYRALLKNGILI